MNWKGFFLAIAFGVAIAVTLVLAFNRWPEMAQSPWAMFGLFIFALICSRVMRRMIRK
jgi:hypothetical protein